jgi:hypothetical protein
MTSKLNPETASIGATLMQVLLEEIRTQRVMWAVMPATMQQEVIDRMAKQVDNALKGGVKRILGAGLPSVVVKLEQITIDDGVKGKITFGAEQLHALTDVVGTEVVLVLSSPEKHTEGVHAFEADADQPALDL